MKDDILIITQYSITVFHRWDSGAIAHLPQNKRTKRSSGQSIQILNRILLWLLLFAHSFWFDWIENRWLSKCIYRPEALFYLCFWSAHIYNMFTVEIMYAFNSSAAFCFPFSFKPSFLPFHFSSPSFSGFLLFGRLSNSINSELVYWCGVSVPFWQKTWISFHSKWWPLILIVWNS